MFIWYVNSVSNSSLIDFAGFLSWLKNMNLPEIKRDLRQAIKECTERGLLQSVKW